MTSPANQGSLETKYHGTLQIVNLPLVQDTKGSPLNPEGQVQTGLSDPDLSLPGWQVAPEPQGLGVHKSFRVNSRQDTNGSPVNPGIKKNKMFQFHNSCHKLDQFSS